MIDDKRFYKRDAYFCSDTKVSLDGNIWHDVLVFDISAGGLGFQSNIIFDVGETLWFDLTIPEFLSNNEVRLRGEINRVEHEEGKFFYGVAFVDVSDDVRIGIDENINLRNRIQRRKESFKD
ncbi:MAG: PilZ domain-containing protein [Oscillospiraceae bacterium]|nr:PilZ domain-containing protein [Oscillospiraceae bacterium]